MKRSSSLSTRETQVGEIAVSSKSAYATQQAPGQTWLYAKPLAFKTSLEIQKKKNMANGFSFSPHVLHWLTDAIHHA